MVLAAASFSESCEKLSTEKNDKFVFKRRIHWTADTSERRDLNFRRFKSLNLNFVVKI